jgi:hypothetical protein
VAVTAAVASQLVILAPRAVTHGTAFTFTVEVLDAYGNLATGYAGTRAVSSSDPAASLPANYTFTTADGAQQPSAPSTPPARSRSPPRTRRVGVNTEENIRRLELVLASSFWQDEAHRCAMEKQTIHVAGADDGYSWRIADADDSSFVKSYATVPSLHAAKSDVRRVLQHGLRRQRQEAKSTR